MKSQSKPIFAAFKLKATKAEHDEIKCDTDATLLISWFPLEDCDCCLTNELNASGETPSVIVPIVLHLPPVIDEINFRRIRKNCMTLNMSYCEYW